MTQFSVLSISTSNSQRAKGIKMTKRNKRNKRIKITISTKMKPTNSLINFNTNCQVHIMDRISQQTIPTVAQQIHITCDIDPHQLTLSTSTSQYHHIIYSYHLHLHSYPSNLFISLSSG